MLAYLLDGGYQNTILDGWGGWLCVLISGLALIGSVYAIIRQARQGESTSWNIPLARRGEVYDLAQSDEGLARMLTEPTDIGRARVVRASRVVRAPRAPGTV